MRRDIVLEVKGNKAVVLTKKGTFKTVRFSRNNCLVVGQDVDSQKFVPVRGKKPFGLPMVATVAVILILGVILNGFLPFQENQTVAAYVSYDINPSVTVAMNDELQIVSVKTWNKEAALLFSKWESYQFMSLEEFTNTFLKRLNNFGYLQDDSQLLMATAVVAKDMKEKQRVTDLLQKTLTSVRNGQFLKQKNIALSVMNAASAEQEQSSKKHVSLGKYLLFLKANDKGMELTLHTIKTLSVAEMNDKIAAFVKKDDQLLAKENPLIPDKGNQPPKSNAEVTLVEPQEDQVEEEKDETNYLKSQRCPKSNKTLRLFNQKKKR